MIETYTQNGQEFRVSVSMGVAFYDKSSKNYTELYHHSDSALYHAKQCGRNRYSLYSPYLNTTATSVKEINLERLVQTKRFEDDISEYIFRILYESPDKTVAINSVLELVGKHYDVCRAYIFEDCPSEGYVRNTFEWCAKHVQPRIDKLQKVMYHDLGDYKLNFANDDIFYLPSVDPKSKISKAILQPACIKSMVQFAIVRNGVFHGFIGFEHCGDNEPISPSTRNDYRNVANILSVFVLEMRSIEAISKEKQFALSIVNQLGSYTYVCNPKTHKLLFANDNVLKVSVGASVGDFCYAALCGRTAPCNDCPIPALKESGLAKLTLPLTDPSNPYTQVTGSWLD